MPDRLRAYRTLSYIDARTAAEIREAVFEDACLSEVEAEAVLTLARAVPKGDPAWRDFYRSVAAEHEDRPRAAAG